MNLYHWSSKLLRDYADGNIVVMAEDIGVRAILKPNNETAGCKYVVAWAPTESELIEIKKHRGMK